jgi:hypothetical protein
MPGKVNCGRQQPVLQPWLRCAPAALKLLFAAEAEVHTEGADE